MAAGDSPKKILIIGAGIAGLFLAQILRKNAIAYEIFDRDESSELRGQGWSVSLSESLPHLEELLPGDLGDLAELGSSYGAGYLDDVSILDFETEKVIARYGGQARGTPGWLLRPDRPKLRKYLWQHANVQLGKKFSHYSEDEENDTITAYFEDGSSATGGLLVGADGSQSKVRRQVLGDGWPGPQLADYQQIIATPFITKEKYEAFRKYSKTTIITPGDGWNSGIALTHSYPDGSAEGFWGICWRTDDPAADVAWMHAAKKSTLLERAKEIANNNPTPSFLRELIDQTPVEAVSDKPPIFSEFVPPASLPRGRATLMGDACHTMVPFRGAGANTALRDAADLGRILIKRWSKEGTAEALLREYEAIALPRGREQVLMSREVGSNYALGRAKILEGRKDTLAETTEVAHP